MYDGEVNYERKYYWIRKVERYFKIQMIKDDDTKIQLT